MSLVRSLLRFRKRNRMISPRRNRVHLETLEPRVLLSDMTYSAAAGAAADLTLRLQKIDDIKKAKVCYESIKDTIIDLIVYCFMLLEVIEEQEKKK